MKNQTGRLVLLAVCLLVLAYFAAGYSIEQGLAQKAAECKRAMYLTGGIGILSLLVSLIVTGGHLFFFTLLMHLIPFAAFGALFLVHLFHCSKQAP